LVSNATLEGRVVHSAAERFANAVAGVGSDRERAVQLRSSFPIRRVVVEEFDKLLDEISNNPRLDGPRISAGVSVDDCVNAFKEIAARLVTTLGRPRGTTAKDSRSNGERAHLPLAAELSVAIDDPPLRGRLDLVRDGVVYDFKTGEPSPAHAEQLRFYALLLWLRYGRLPAALRLIYSKRREEVEVPTPDEPDMDLLKARYAKEVTGIVRSLQAGMVPPAPSTDGCMFCPVRQGCSAYWTAEVTSDLRDPTKRGRLFQPGETWRGDVQLTRLPPSSHTKGCVGEALSPQLGRVSVWIDRSRCPANVEPTGARLLGARVQRTETAWNLEVTPTTEVFWIDSDADACWAAAGRDPDTA
jgi:hypothetical protein